VITPGVNPTKQQVVNYVTNKAEEMNIPIQLALATAWTENRFTHFNSNGISGPNASGDYGLMQVNIAHKVGGSSWGWISEEDWEKVENDWTFNIDIGLQIHSDTYTTAKNKDDLVNGWNTMGSSDIIDFVGITTHGDSTGLSFGEGSVALGSSDIVKLDHKNVETVFLSGCNAGHLDYIGSNPASEFARIINGGRVIASDGTDFVTRNETTQKLSYASVNDEAFENFTPDIIPDIGSYGPHTPTHRNNEGWLIYSYIGGHITTSPSLGDVLTFSEILELK